MALGAVLPVDAAAIYFGMAIMVGSALLLRRSLGAMPVWLSVLAAMVTLDIMMVLRDGSAAEQGMQLLADVMVLPTLFMMLTRLGAIPGLRRGSPEGERKRQIALLRDALARQADLRRPRGPARRPPLRMRR